MTNTPKEDSPQEIARRRDEGLKRMLKTPPQPHKDHSKKSESSLTKSKGRG